MLKRQNKLLTLHYIIFISNIFQCGKYLIYIAVYMYIYIVQLRFLYYYLSLH
jgi:hypothetical protein